MSGTEYSKTPLIKKLGIKKGQVVIFMNQPSHFIDLLGVLPAIETLENPPAESVDYIHMFCTSLSELESHFPELKKAMKKDAMFWVSWPKGTSSIKSELDGNIVRRFGLMQGLVDVKVCAIDENWSGLKFMYRLKDRK